MRKRPGGSVSVGINSGSVNVKINSGLLDLGVNTPNGCLKVTYNGPKPWTCNRMLTVRLMKAVI